MKLQKIASINRTASKEAATLLIRAADMGYAPALRILAFALTVSWKSMLTLILKSILLPGHWAGIIAMALV